MAIARSPPASACPRSRSSLIGAGTALFTGRNAAVTSLRSLALGLAAAAITYGVGRWVGVTLS